MKTNKIREKFSNGDYLLPVIKQFKNRRKFGVSFDMYQRISKSKPLVILSPNDEI